MSHYHCEIVIPNTTEVEKSIAQVMSAFNEDNEDSSHSFWDWYVIGGRWAGAKLQASLDFVKLEQFHELLKDMKVTVSGFQAGKQELQPASQIPEVDALWRECFPDLPPGPCPLFAHSNDQYAKVSGFPQDIAKFSDVPDRLNCSRVIFAGPSYDGSKLEAKGMLQTDFWNGVEYLDSTWDGSFKSAKEHFIKRIESYRDDYRQQVEPKPDSLVVTVDYHS